MIRPKVSSAVTTAAVIGLALLLPWRPATAAPAAIVEDVAPSLTAPEILDYLDEGSTIELKPGDWLVVDYLSSCVREEIHGGKITIGNSQSTVAGGQVKRNTVPCTSNAQLSQAQAGKSGGMVFRKPPKPAGQALPHASLTVSSLSPILRPRTASAIQLQRLDQADKVVALPAGRAADLEKLGLRLAPGGLYRATAGTASIVFRIDPAALPQGGPLLNRLVQF